MFNVSNHNFSRDYFWSKVDRSGSCWIWKSGHFGTGYGAFSINNKNYGAHVIAFLISGGKLTVEKPHVLHSCNNRGCVNPNHLRAGSAQDNVDDAMRKGNHGLALIAYPRKRAKGMKHGMAILTDAKVRAIRAEYRPYVLSRTELAKKYGVSRSTINQVLSRKHWKHVT